MSSNSSPQGADAVTNVLERIRYCAASVTRYPIDILTADAQLEDELGIDSVKLAEIAAVVGRELNLPPERLPKGGKARTLRAMAEVVAPQSESEPRPRETGFPSSGPPHRSRSLSARREESRRAAKAAFPWARGLARPVTFPSSPPARLAPPSRAGAPAPAAESPSPAAARAVCESHW